MVAWSMKRCLGGYWNIKSNYLIMRAFSLYTGSECMRLFEVVEVNFMNELEKCMAGEWYDCHNAIFLEYKNNARNLLSQYNSFSYNQKKEKTEVLKQLFGSMGTNVSVGFPFICDYGKNIHIGTNVSINLDYSRLSRKTD